MALKYLILTVTALSLPGCSGVNVGRDISPPTGTSLTKIQGTTVMFNCSIFNNETQLITQWRVSDASGSSYIDIRSALGPAVVRYDGIPLVNPFSTINTTRNILIIRDFNLHNTTLQCHFAAEVFAEYLLYVYRAPNILNITTIRVISGSQNISINMENMNIPPYPFPSFRWTFNGNPVTNSSAAIFYYPTVKFLLVDTSLSGSYSLSATNYFVDEPSSVFGSATGSFQLDVFFGPSIRRGDTQRAVELGAPLSLLCGDKLMSNPPATIIWQDLRGGMVMDNSRYDIISDVAGVRLNFTDTNLNDNGQWTCSVAVAGQNITVSPNSEVISMAEVGREEFEIEVFVVDPPSQPSNLLVEETGGTWAVLNWTKPSDEGLQGIAFYIATAGDIDGNYPDTTFSNLDNSTIMNMTNLFSAVSYSFSVQAVSMALDVEVRSQASNPSNSTTLLSSPAPRCERAYPNNGGIKIEFSFIHTGGQTITGLIITYTIAESNGNTETQAGPAVEAGIRSADIPKLVAGNIYTVAIMATNLNGSTTATCPALTLTIGLPQPPLKPTLMELTNNTLSLRVRSLFPGSESVIFTVTPLLITATSDTAKDEIRKDIPSYHSGVEVEVIIHDLNVGSTYRFRVNISNKFGNSTVLSDEIIVLGIQPTSNTNSFNPFIGSPSFAITVGTITGAIMVLLLVGIVLIFMIAIWKRKCKKFKVAQIDNSSEKPEVEKKETKVDEVEDQYKNLGKRLEEAMKPTYYENVIRSRRCDTPEQEMEMKETVIYTNVTLSLT